MPFSEGLCFGPFEFDPAAGALFLDHQAIPLDNQPTKLLALLLAQSGEAATSTQIRGALWDPNTSRAFRGLYPPLRHPTAGSARRRRGQTVYIINIRKQGYRFIAPVHKRLVELPDQRWTTISPSRKAAP